MSTLKFQMLVRKPAFLWQLLILILAPGMVLQVKGQWCPAAFGANDDPISAEEFSRIVRDFSEESGFYLGPDNFTSNERGYPAVVAELKKIPVRGDAYIGVGPEQNFTYIAKLRPRIAFIIDIRRQAVIQHLMYKAIFQMAEDRAAFLALLLNRPLAGNDAPGHDASVTQLTAYFSNTKVDENIFESNLAEIARTIRDDFQVPMSSKDQAMLRRIYGEFRKRGLRISFGDRPTLKELIEAKGPDGTYENFLATREDYQFLRDLQLSHRIIPVVGDFAGPKALKSVASYLREKSYSVSVFYASNVEALLDRDGKFRKYADNIRNLPITTGSFFVRWPRGVHKTMLLQQMTVFFEKYERSSIFLDYSRVLEGGSIRVKSK